MTIQLVSFFIVSVCGIGVIIAGIFTIKFSREAIRYNKLTVKILNREPLTDKEQALLETLHSYRKENDQS